jgi:hypothetical protein
MVRACLLGVMFVGVGACVDQAPEPAAPAPAPAPAPKPQLPAAADLLQKVEAAYAHAASYADHGSVTDAFTSAQGNHNNVKTFGTAFIRPDRFRFEYRKDGDATRAYIIWADHGSVHSRWYVKHNAVEEAPSLMRAIAAATGVSSGTAYIVPHLLMPNDLSGPSVTALVDARVEGTEFIAGHPCYKVTGTPRDMGPRTLYIDAQSYALRRIVERAHLTASAGEQPFDVETTIEYDPALNGTVTDAQLAGPTP